MAEPLSQQNGRNIVKAGDTKFNSLIKSKGIIMALH